MVKHLEIVYHPNKGKEIDEEQVRKVLNKIAVFLVKKAMKKVTYS